MASCIPEKLDIMFSNFSKEGYTTAAIGKWGLMSSTWKDENLHAHYFPMATGILTIGTDLRAKVTHTFTIHFGCWKIRNSSSIRRMWVSARMANYELGKGSHAHDLFLEKSLNFIDKNKGNPFFLYIPFAIPHAELVVPSDCKFLALYKSLGWPEIPKIAGTGNTGGAKGNAGYGSPYKDGYCSCDHPHATYAAMISRMDASVGKIRKKVKDLGLKKDPRHFQAIMEPQLKGDKRWTSSKAQVLLEAASEVPTKAAPEFPSSLLGRKRSQLVRKAIMSAASTTSSPPPLISSVSRNPKPPTVSPTSPTLLGKPEEQTQAPYRYYWWRGTEAIRKGDWKLITNKNGKPNELYNLHQDPGESHNNVIEANPEVVKVLFPLIEDAKKPL